LQARGGAPFFGGPELFGGGTMEKWQPESLLMRREREDMGLDLLWLDPW